DREDLRRFTHEFVQAANRTDPPANFLIAVQENAAPGLKRLRRRIAGFTEHGIRLSLHEDGTFALTPLNESDTALQAALGSAGGAPRPQPLKPEDVYSTIEQLLEKTHAQENLAPWPESAPGTAPPLDAPLMSWDSEPAESHEHATGAHA